jgi:hypothetical protein
MHFFSASWALEEFHRSDELTRTVIHIWWLVLSKYSFHVHPAVGNLPR